MTNKRKGIVLLSVLSALSLLVVARYARAQEAANSAFIAGYKYTHISTATNTLIKPSAGVIHTVVVNVAGTSVTVNDASAANCTGGTTIAAITTSTGTFTYDTLTGNGICIITAGAADVTVSS